MALAVRGECDFVTKAKFAQTGDAGGLVIINDDEGFLFLDSLRMLTLL